MGDYIHSIMKCSVAAEQFRAFDVTSEHDNQSRRDDVDVVAQVAYEVGGDCDLVRSRSGTHKDTTGYDLPCRLTGCTAYVRRRLHISWIDRPSHLLSLESVCCMRMWLSPRRSVGPGNRRECLATNACLLG